MVRSWDHGVHYNHKNEKILQASQILSLSRYRRCLRPEDDEVVRLSREVEGLREAQAAQAALLRRHRAEAAAAAAEVATIRRVNRNLAEGVAEEEEELKAKIKEVRGEVEHQGQDMEVKVKGFLH